MNPFKILIFLICVFLLILIIAVIFPACGISVGDEVKLKFVSIDDIFKQDSSSYADISEILTNSSLDHEEDPEIIDTVRETAFETTGMDTLRADPDSLKKITHLIDFPAGKQNLLYPFFSRIHNVKKTNELVRVLHYGDSQIETDRMTSYIRHKMQTKFGGSGCGLVPAIPLYNGKMSITQTNSDNWKRYPGFVKKDSSVKHDKYGALLAFSSYEVEEEKQDQMQAWLEYKPSKIAYSTARKFRKVSLYFGNVYDSLKMNVLVNDSIIDSLSIRPNYKYQSRQWRFSSTPDKMSFNFYGTGTCDIMGVSFDGLWGVAVDNIPLRGSSGLDFSKNDTSYLRQMYADLNPGLFILQFGGNVIPYMDGGFEKYKRFFMRELKVIKKIAPGVPVIVIGPSDMSKKVKGKYETYPNLENVRNALKEATLESGFAFWDMYEAMGGKNSMPSWVNAEPALAITDFVHFNSRGARLISEMFYNALIYEYNTWVEP
jgi:lysophospholipase L1-like esterase